LFRGNEATCAAGTDLAVAGLRRRMGMGSTNKRLGSAFGSTAKQGEMKTTRALLTVAGMLITSVALPAVTVHESPASGLETNSISEGNFSSAKIGGPPPKPWQCSKSTEKVRAIVETPTNRPEGERWVRLVDDSDKETANIRQSFAPVTSGRFQVRLISGKAGGRLFFNLGSGNASKPEERAVQLSMDADGSLLARGEKKAKTAFQIKTGEVYLVRCDFEPIRDGKALRVVAELAEEKSQRQDRIETQVETQVAITALRITSIGTDTGVDYYVTDVSLTGR